MRNWLYKLWELLYGAALLTGISAAPVITIKLRVYQKLVESVTFSFPDIWTTLLWSLFLTAVAMLPTVGMMPKNFARHRRINYLVMAPWIITCCRKFLMHAGLHMLAIGDMTDYKDPRALTIALVIYFVVFAMATEMVMHWIQVANKLVDLNLRMVLR